MLGPVSIQRLAQVHPALSHKISTLESIMSEPIGVTQGLRTSKEQLALYSQGRNGLAFVNQLRQAVGWSPLTDTENVRVTDAPPGFTWHEFGLAVDVVPFESNGQPDWDEQHPVWQEIVTKGTGLGLTSGKSWKDEPHLQLTGIFPVAAPTDAVRQLFKQGGLPAVWQAAQIGSN